MSTLLNAYEQVWRKAPNPEVEQFCREIIKKIIDIKFDYNKIDNIKEILKMMVRQNYIYIYIYTFL